MLGKDKRANSRMYRDQLVIEPLMVFNKNTSHDQYCLFPWSSIRCSSLREITKAY
jgi:hypothetical protein